MKSTAGILATAMFFGDRMTASPSLAGAVAGDGTAETREMKRHRPEYSWDETTQTWIFSLITARCTAVGMTIWERVLCTFCTRRVTGRTERTRFARCTLRRVSHTCNICNIAIARLQTPPWSDAAPQWASLNAWNLCCPCWVILMLHLAIWNDLLQKMMDSWLLLLFPCYTVVCRKGLFTLEIFLLKFKQNFEMEFRNQNFQCKMGLKIEHDPYCKIEYRQWFISKGDCSR